MQILCTVDTYYPFKDGVQNITQNHIEMLQKKGYKIIVFTTIHGDNEPSFEKYNGVEIYRFKLNTKYGIHFGERKKYIEKVLEVSKKVDVMLNICMQSATTDLILKFIDDIKCRKILYLHGMYRYKFEKSELNDLKKFIKKVYFNVRWKSFYIINKKKIKKYDEIINIHQNDEATNYFENITNKKVNIIFNFVEEYVIENLNMEKKEQMICISNYSELKNQKYILEILEKCNLKNKIKVSFIGTEENEYLNQLKSLNENIKSKMKNIEIEFLVDMNRKEMIDLLKTCKMFLLGSKIEKVPVVILEAIAAGVPFVSTDVGLIKYIPGGVVCTNKEEFIKEIESLNENEKRRTKFILEGRNFVLNECSLEISNKKLEKILLKR